MNTYNLLYMKPYLSEVDGGFQFHRKESPKVAAANALYRIHPDYCLLKNINYSYRIISNLFEPNAYIKLTSSTLLDFIKQLIADGLTFKLIVNEDEDEDCNTNSSIQRFVESLNTSTVIDNKFHSIWEDEYGESISNNLKYIRIIQEKNGIKWIMNINGALTIQMDNRHYVNEKITKDTIEDIELSVVTNIYRMFLGDQESTIYNEVLIPSKKEIPHPLQRLKLFISELETTKEILPISIQEYVKDKAFMEALLKESIQYENKTLLSNSN